MHARHTEFGRIVYRIILGSITVIVISEGANISAAPVMLVADLESADGPSGEPGEIGNLSIAERLGVLGHTVAEVDDDEAVDTPVDGMELIVIASSVLSTKIGFQYAEVPLPIVNFEAGLWDELFLSDHGDLVSGESIEVIDTSHPLAELMGLTEQDEFVFRDSPSAAPVHLGRYDNLAPGGVIIAEQASGGLPTIAVVDTGAELNDGSAAPAPRIMIPFGDEGVDGLNDVGLAIFDAAIRYALGGPKLAGDFNANGELDAEDIDLLSLEVRDMTANLAFDLNDDGAVDGDDRSFWVKDLRQTWFGDANLDGEFNSSDFVSVFQRGEYEDDDIGNSTWPEGDWNGDSEFSSADFVQAFQDGGFERGPAGVVQAVPEPQGLALTAMSSVVLLLMIRHTCHRIVRHRLQETISC